MTRPGPRRLAAAALALAVACTRGREPGDPTPLAVNPRRAPATVPVQVEISGKDLDAHVATDFESSGAGRDRLDAGYGARLEPAAGAPVALTGVRLTGRRTLLATVPAGVAPGTYRLVVTDPAGRTGALERAYRVVSSPEAVVRFAVTVLGTPRAGVAFPISIAALDASGEVVDGFEGTVTVSDTAGNLAAATCGPFVLGRFGGPIAVPGLAAGDALVATDGAGHEGASPPFDVVAGPPVEVVFPSAPVAAAPGTCSPRVDLALRDAYGHPAVSEAGVVAELQSAAAGVEFFADPGCTIAAATVAVPGGGSGAAFHFRAAAAGPVALRAVPASLPSAIQVETVAP